MSAKERTKGVAIGVVCTDEAERQQIAQLTVETELGVVVFDSAPGAVLEGAEGLARSGEGGPELFLVRSDEQEKALQLVRYLQANDPDAWILLVAESDPQLIIEAMRAGAREFLPSPVTAESLRDALDRYLSKRKKRLEEKEPGKIYAVTSGKGGTGATTVAINLATTISQLPDVEVALLDLVSPLGDTAAYLNLKPQYNLEDALEAGDRIDAVLLDTFMSRTAEISVLAGPGEYTPGRQLDAKALVKTFKVVREEYTHTIVDLPRDFDQGYLEGLLDLSEAILVVLTPEVTSLWQTHRLLRYLQQYVEPERLKVVLNRSQKSDEITRRDIEKTMEIPIYWSLPNDYRAVLQAMNSGTPLASSNHTGLARGYRDMAEALTGIAFEKQKKGILGLFNS